MRVSKQSLASQLFHRKSQFDTTEKENGGKLEEEEGVPKKKHSQKELQQFARIDSGGHLSVAKDEGGSARVSFTASGGKRLSNKSSENSKEAHEQQRVLGTGSVSMGVGDDDEVQKEEEDEEEENESISLPQQHNGDKDEELPRITFTGSSHIHEIKEEDDSPIVSI